eukprot:GGOE01043141.1.p1 GENE.GGOE01043141.1~~GGOE01043141.1.p1  ORF type:complete len:507 (-),score=171.08 GGOE01043141.1:459-1979(-)
MASADLEAKGLLAGVQLQLAECKRQLMLKDEEILTQQRELQALRQQSQTSSKSSSLSIFGKSNKKVTQLTHEIDALQLKEAQLEPLKKDIRRLQEENVDLRSKLACQAEWSTRDEYIRGLQGEIEFQKQAVEQERQKFQQKDADFTRLLEETMERSSKDMEEMNRLMEQVARLSSAKKASDDIAKELADAQKQIRRLEDEMAFLTAASMSQAPDSPGEDGESAPDGEEGNAPPPPPKVDQEGILAKWRAELKQLEGTVQERDTTIAEQQAELTILREAKAKSTARIEELEGRQRASRQELQTFVKVIKDLQSTQAALTQSSKNLESELSTARGKVLECTAELDTRAGELRALREAIRKDGQDWVRDTVVSGWLVWNMERKLLIAERTKAEAQVKKLEHTLREKGDECESLETRLDELQEEALQLVSQVRREGDTPEKTPRDKHNVFQEAGKPFKALGKNLGKLKPKDKNKEDITEMKRLVQETLQKNMDLEAENKWLREHAKNRSG